MNEREKTVTLDEDDLQTTSFLKSALDYDTDAEVVRESLRATQKVVRVIRDGGTVILKEKNGKANKMVVKK